jgi:hypothetical protein
VLNVTSDSVIFATKDEDVKRTPVCPVQTTQADLLTRQPVLLHTPPTPDPPTQQTMLCLVQKLTAMRSPAHVYQHHLLSSSESISSNETDVCRCKNGDNKNEHNGIFLIHGPIALSIKSSLHLDRMI